jgi:hypothetical protein
MRVLDEIVFRVSPKRVIAGLPVAVLLATPDDERAVAFARIADAMALIERYAPVRFEQVRRDVARILVYGEPSFRGAYAKESRTCELFVDWVVAHDTNPAALAGAIVHEAQHGRLFRLGFGYDAPFRHRIERVCYRATRAFARRIPDGDALVPWTTRCMAVGEDAYSAASGLRRRIDAIDRIGLPRWLQQLLRLRLRRKLTRALSAQKPAGGRPTTE